MKTIKERVQNERDEVQERLIKLEKFMMDPNSAFITLSNEAQKLLVEQALHMGHYVFVLHKRLELLETESA